MEWFSSEYRSFKAKWSPRGVSEDGQDLEARRGKLGEVRKQGEVRYSLGLDWQGQV